MSLADQTIHELRERLRRNEISPLDIVNDVLDRIEAREETLNAYIDVFAEEARRRAVELEDVPPDERGLLFGIPIAVKDNIVVKGFDTTCGSRILLGFKSPYNATVIERLLQHHGIVLGKTNLDEFAMGSSGEYSFFGPTRNPHNPDFVPGGSSSGSAAAVASGEAVAALGSDTGGSVRLPAAYTHTVGFKPTYGRLSRYGLVAFASSLDQIGFLTRDVLDAALLFEALGGHDPLDSTSLNLPAPRVSEVFPPDWERQRFTLGVPVEYVEAEGLDPEIRLHFQRYLEQLEREGFRLQEIHLPHSRYAVQVYYLVATAEASSNLARYDGVRYGFRAEGYADLDEMYRKTRSEGFGPEVKRRILLGTFALSSGYHEEYYNRALRVRRLIQKDFQQAFEAVDLIVTPTAPTFPPRLGEKRQDPLAMYLLDIFTVSANLAGIPAISVPGGFGGPHRLPYGLQFLAPAFEDGRVFQMARWFERFVYPGR